MASSKCKPSYMKRTRTACTVPPRTWCTTGGSLGIGGAFYGVLCRQWRTNPIFAKREIWGRNISPPLLKGPKSRFGFLVDPCTTRPSPRPRIDRRSPCNASDEATRPQAIPTRRRAEGMFIHTRGGAMNRPLPVTWYATGVCYGHQIPGQSRCGGSKCTSRVTILTPEKKPHK